MLKGAQVGMKMIIEGNLAVLTLGVLLSMKYLNAEEMQDAFNVFSFLLAITALLIFLIGLPIYVRILGKHMNLLKIMRKIHEVFTNYDILVNSLRSGFGETNS